MPDKLGVSPILTGLAKIAVRLSSQNLKSGQSLRISQKSDEITIFRPSGGYPSQT